MLKVSNSGFIYLLAVLVFSGCEKKAETGQNAPSQPPVAAASAPTAATPPKGLQQTAEGFSYEDLEIGEGPRPVIGQSVTIKYVGKLDDGKVIDSGKIEFPLGSAGYLKGFNLGIGGARDLDAMREGGKRKIILPPALAYGKDGDPPKIPANATITFEIELVKIQASKSF